MVNLIPPVTFRKLPSFSQINPLCMEPDLPNAPVKEKSIRKRIIKQMKKKKFSFGGLKKEASSKRKSKPSPSAEEGAWVKVHAPPSVHCFCVHRPNTPLLPSPRCPPLLSRNMTLPTMQPTIRTP